MTCVDLFQPNFFQKQDPQEDAYFCRALDAEEIYLKCFLCSQGTEKHLKKLAFNLVSE